jgi:uncharacterized membrane protein
VSALARIWLGAAAYAVVLFALGMNRYQTYHSGADLGLFTQSIASVFHGFSNTIEGGSHFRVHFSPILYLCAPLLLATRSPLALIAIAAIAGALVGPPLFLFARRHVPEGLALGVAAVGLLYPPLTGVIFADFHENVFAPALTLWLIWAVDARRFRLAALFLVLTLCIKEDQAPILACAALFAFVYFWRARETAGMRFAGAAFVLSVATFVAFFAIVRPLAGATEGWSPLHFYAWSNTAETGSTPWYSIGRPAYFLEALVPLAFVCLLSPLFLLALPGFAECLFSHDSVTYTMGQHYAAPWIGYVLAAFALGVARLYARRSNVALIALRTALVLCVANLAFASPTHWGHYLGKRTAHDRLVDRELASLPPALDVGTHDELFAHLGFDPNASLGLAREPEAVLIDRNDQTSYWVERLAPILEQDVAQGRYRLVRAVDGVERYQRVEAP